MRNKIHRVLSKVYEYEIPYVLSDFIIAIVKYFLLIS